jgi:hypothetical protein
VSMREKVSIDETARFGPAVNCSPPPTQDVLADFDQLTSPPNDASFRQRAASTISISGKGVPHEGIASADLQNPSDALEILAQVADRAEDGDSPGSEQIQGQSKGFRPPSRRQDPSPPKMDNYLHYKPFQDGLISPEMVSHLFST